MHSEIIIVNDGSTDSTWSLLQTASQQFDNGWLRILTQSNQGQAVARQYGVAQSRGKYLLFLDDDMVLSHSEVLANHLTFHSEVREPQVGLGVILAPIDRDSRPAFEYFYERSIASLYRNFVNGSLRPSGIHFFSAHVSLSKELFLRSGGFNPSFRQAEDRELGLRLDFVLKTPFNFLTSASAFHYSTTQKYRNFLHRAQLYGHYDLKIAQLYPNHPEIHPDQIFQSKSIFKRWLAIVSWNWPKSLYILSKILIAAAWILDIIGLRSLAVTCCSALYCVHYVYGYRQSLLQNSKQNPQNRKFHDAA